MKRITALALLAAAQLLTHTVPLHAQVIDATSQRGLDDGDALRLHNEFVRSYLLPVTGHPYTADEVTEITRTLADGNRIQSLKRQHKMRDRDGRQRYTINAVLDREHTVIIDPVTTVAYLIRPERKDVLRLRSIIGGRRILLGRTVEPTWIKEVRTPLGIKQMDGVNALGTLTETTHRAGAFGSEREMVETREMWYSNEMQMTMLARTSSPRMGERSTRMENLRLENVPASAFALPADYQVRDVTAGKGGAPLTTTAEQAESAL